MGIKIYEGYEIEAKAVQLDDNSGWSASVRIYAPDSRYSNGKVFNLSEIHINREEAIKYGLIIGQRFIDGVIEGIPIEDLSEYQRDESIKE